MMTQNLCRIESVVVSALEQAAADYRRDRGPFVPFARNRIHEALGQYQALPHIIPKTRFRHSHDDAIDPAAFRRGIIGG
jgi:hypothetical protein